MFLNAISPIPILKQVLICGFCYRIGHPVFYFHCPVFKPFFSPLLSVISKLPSLHQAFKLFKNELKKKGKPSDGNLKPCLVYPSTSLPGCASSPKAFITKHKPSGSSTSSKIYIQMLFILQANWLTPFPGFHLPFMCRCGVEDASLSKLLKLSLTTFRLPFNKEVFLPLPQL